MPGALQVHNEYPTSTLGATLDTIVKQEDAVHVSGEKGIMALAVRNAGLANLTSTERDYSPIAVDAKGRILIQSIDEEGAAISEFIRVAIGGKTVSSTGYIPGAGTDEAMMLAFDAVNGRALVQDDKIEAVQVSVPTITSTSTTFVNGATIDLRGFQRISLFPEVTTAAGTNADYKIQWSFDAVTWFDETIDSAGTPASNESVITQSTMIRRFPSGSTGVKTLASITLDKKARYVRFAQRSDAAVTVICTYRYQLLKV